TAGHSRRRKEAKRRESLSSGQRHRLLRRRAVHPRKSCRRGPGGRRLRTARIRRGGGRKPETGGDAACPAPVAPGALSRHFEALVESVAGAAYGADRVGIATAVYRLAEAPHMHIHGAFVDID